MRFRTLVSSIAFAAALMPAASAQNGDAGRAAFREIYEEMVEIDSSPTTGSCTKVVQAAEKRLKAAGFSASDVQLIIPPGKPDDGNLVARIRAQSWTRGDSAATAWRSASKISSSWARTFSSAPRTRSS